MFALVEAGLGHSLINGYEQPVFMGILAIILEFGWYMSRRSNAIAPAPR